MSRRSASGLPGITLKNGFKFRKGQAEFLEKLAVALQAGEENHLGVFVPGYGKTITALSSFVVAQALGIVTKLVIFVPRGNLRDQYADAEELAFVFDSIGAPTFSYCVADSDKVFLKNIDTEIIITTYQYASGDNGNLALKKYCASAETMFVFDEVHHLADDGTWARSIGNLSHKCSIALSGTPLRSDNKTLFGVPFQTDDEGTQFYDALHEVTMRDAHEEGKILKRVKAHIIDYRLKMLNAETGDVVEMSLSMMVEEAKSSREVDAYLARRRLRFHDVYLESLLAPAFHQFAEKRMRTRRSAGRNFDRYTFRNHQMLIIAMSNRHAAEMLAFVQRRFPDWRSGRIGQDVPAKIRAKLLEEYRTGQLDVMVQVDMIGEGTDIKPISVIVKADLVRAWSKTLQQIFRGMRYFSGFNAKENLCDIYSANDSAVVTTLEWVAAEEQIGIKMKKEKTSNQLLPNAPEQRESSWELQEVQQRNMKTHSLQLSVEASSQQTVEVKPRVVNVQKKERALRKECASLASELAFLLKGTSKPATISQIHARAKKHYSKAQGALSIKELSKKRDWLIRCLDRGRMI